MSEAIILYRGRGGVDPERLKPTTITSNGIYEAPVTGTYRVSCVGGGGGGGGGCRNSWNSSQVFYGSAGSRGSLTTTNVTLNAGDKIQVNLGAGGAGGTNNTTVVSNNSRGTNGSAGGTTTFGSLVSGAGGTYGQWSWSYHYISWTNVGTRIGKASVSGVFHRDCYDKGNANWSNTYNSNGYSTYAHISNTSFGLIASTQRTSSWQRLSSPYTHGSNTFQYGYFYPYAYCTTCGKRFSVVDSSSFEKYRNDLWSNNWFGAPISTDLLTNMFIDVSYPVLGLQASASILDPGYCLGFMGYLWSNVLETIWQQNPVNTSTRCYTSIQQGSWWFTSSNQVISSGTQRAYRGDGGSSGQAGNAGFVLVIPPTI